MGELLVDLVKWFETLSPAMAYGAILLVAYGENVMPPVPGDMIVVFGGYLASIGNVNLGGVIALSTVGGVLGFMTMYALGRVVGSAILDPERFKWIPKARVKRARKRLRKWGFALVAANRFLSGLRSVISLTVGMAHMNVLRTALYATLSAVIWTSLIAYAGFLLGENWADVSGYIQRYGTVIFVVIVCVIAVQSVRYVRSRRDGESSAEMASDVEP